MDYASSVRSSFPTLPSEGADPPAEWKDLMVLVDAAQRDGEEAAACVLIDQILDLFDERPALPKYC